MPVVEMPDGMIPSYEPMEYTPHEYTAIPLPRPPVGRDGEEDGEAAAIPELPPKLGVPGADTTKVATEEKSEPEKPFLEKAIDGLPPVEAVVTTTTIALVAATSALVAKPFSDLILKLIKPTVKKVVKKVSKLRGKVEKIDSVWERRLAQRDRNRALRALRRALKP
jgi:hypothetical protein